MSDHIRVTIGGSAPATDPSLYPIGVIFDMPSHMLDGFALENTKECDRAIANGYTRECERGELYLWVNDNAKDRRGWYAAFDPVEEEYLLVNPVLLEGV